MTTEKKRTIGVDKDDVLVEFNLSLQKFHNARFGTNLRMDDIFSYNLCEVWHCSYEEVVERVTAFYKSGEMKRVLPMEGAIEAIKSLRQRFDLVVITSRPQEYCLETAFTTEKYFPGCFSAIHHTNLLIPDWRTRRKKSEVCLEVGADTLIDDSLENVRDCASFGIKSLLYRRPWNLSVSDEKLLAEGITPVRSWQEILNHLA